PASHQALNAGCGVKRLIRPTVQCPDLVGLIRRVSVASGVECRMRRKTPYPAYGSVLGFCRPDKTRQRRIRR
ncbi:hypothetical protein RCN73_10980, partial [Escherichia marmotae]|nr:hypothetical protein [Escherichia marmotae]MED9053937.1 hypothetical protein [Escherichia marmotae]MED9777578.1 hypothetical protein [Escherichia marmotae]